MSLNSIGPMRLFLLAPLFLVGACATGTSPALPPAPSPNVGVLVMAHGGSAEWDRAIERVVEPLAGEVPLELAFGMANPTTLSRGLDSLRERGVDQVVMVRMFLSGTSFQHQTEYLVGLRADRPRWFVTHGAGHGADPEPIEHGLRVVTHTDGLSDEPAVATIVNERVAGVSRAPSRESVLVLAHGVGDEVDNDLLLGRMKEATRELQGQGFQEVRVATLREDWQEKRAAAELEIRSFVAAQAEDGNTVIVVPYRLFGTGPYADVLAGLDYKMTASLMPHAVVEGWVRATAARMMCANGWPSPLPCPVATSSR